MKLYRRYTILLLIVVGIGCGSEPTGPEKVPVTGTVSLNGESLPGAVITFIPTGKTPGLGGTARSDASGKFVLTSARGGEGAPAGEYRVAVSRRLMPDGSPVPADDKTPPIESPAQESLPPIYSNPEMTQLTATVTPDGPPIQLALTAKGGG